MRFSNNKQLNAKLSDLIATKGCLITSDEPSLRLKAQQSIRNAILANDEVEKTSFDVDARFDWSELELSINSFSLFSSKKFIELIFSAKPDAKAQKAITECFSSDNSDLFILIITPRIDAKGFKTKWVSEIESKGAVVTLYPPDHSQLPEWIHSRAEEEGVQIDSESITFIAQHNEGNLFAIDQLLMQLKFLHGNHPLTIEDVQEVASENSQFVAFDLSNALLTGDYARIYRIISTLRSEGEVPTLINWVLQKEIATIGKMQEKLKNGTSIDQVLSDIWDRQKPMYRTALQRISPKLHRHLVSMVVQIDFATKGQLNENPWNAIMRTAFAFAGKRLLPLSAEVKI